MTNRDTTLVRLGDIPAALGLLTRLPVQVKNEQAVARGAAAAWAYPLVGLVVGTLAAGIGTAALWLGMPTALAAGLALALQVIITGAMHEDGLADSMDGLWGGWDKERRLAIMKDSHIGTYGVIALIVSLGLRWLALTALFAAGAHWAALIAVAAFSRAAMVALMTGLPHARMTGLSRTVGRPNPKTAWLAIGIATIAGVAFAGLDAATLLIVGGVITSLWAGIARTKIGGQTGDILGAAQQFTEIALLLTLTVLI